MDELENQLNNTDFARSWGSQITVDGQEYAASLFWQSLQNQDNPNAEVLESSQSILEGADLYCVKKGKTPQYGICISSEGYKQGMYAAAATLATALSDQPSFVAVFKVNNGWWYVCVRDDVILANGDMLYLSEEDAKKQFMSMLMVPDWKLKIAPAEWQIEDTLSPDLADILERGSKSKLLKINTRSKYFFPIVGGISFIALIIVYNLFMAMLDTKPAAPVVVPIKPKQVEAPPPEPKPWESLADVNQVLNNCYDAIKQVVGVYPPGWNIAPVVCDTASVTTSWSREYGRIAIIDKALNSSGVNFSSKSIAGSGNSVMAAVSVAQASKDVSEPTMNQTDLKNTINDLFQSLNMKISLSDFTYTSPQNNIYKSVKFRFSSNYNPLYWQGLFGRFSGLYIQSIKYNPSSSVWEYEGAIYAI